MTLLGPGFSTILEADAQGICRREAMPTGRYRLEADAPGRAVLAKSMALPAEGLAAPVLLRLRRGGSVRGRVRGEDGAPLPGVRVVAYGLHSVHERSTTTDENGEYGLEGLDRVALLAFTAEGFALRRVRILGTGSAARPVIRNVRMGRGATVRGTVRRSDGTPVPGARVEIGRPIRLPTPYELPWTLTDDQGEFLLRCVPPGRLRLRSGTASAGLHAREGKRTLLDLRLS